MSRELFVSILAATSLGLVACGGGSDDDNDDINGADAGGTVQADAGGTAQPDAAITPDPDASVEAPDAGADACDLCAPNATCEVDVCTCPEGLFGDGTIAGTGCEADVDECAAGTSGCLLECENTAGGFVCNDRILATRHATGEMDIISLSYDPDPLIDDTSTVESTVAITGSLGEVITGTTGLAKDPTTGIIYAVVKEEVEGRQLAQLDPVTGVATLIGILAEDVSTIAFNDAGVLFTTTGLNSGATVYSTLSLVDGSRTEILALEEGDSTDGETLVSRAGDPLMYRWSGNDPYDFQSVDALGVTVDLLQPTLAAEGEKTAAVYSNMLDAFILNDRDSFFHIYGLDQTGDSIPVETDGYHKGLVLVPAPVAPPKP